MATNQISKQGTLLDVMNGFDRAGNRLPVAEILTKATPMFKEAPWKEANGVTQHKFQQRYSLPTSTKIAFNKGASSSLGSTRTLTVEMQGRENRPSIDARLIKIAPDMQTYLNDNAAAAIEGIGQDLETDIIYGSIANGDAYDGLAVQLDSLSQNNVYDGGASTGNLSSMYLICWDQRGGAYLAYPKGTMAGVSFEDEGTRNKDMPDGSVLKVHEMHIEVTAGLCIEDGRAIARIANIGVDNIGKSTFNEDLFILAVNEMPTGKRASAVSYAPRKVKSALDIRANDKGNAYYTRDNVFGEEVLKLFGVPVRLDEMISEAEDQVV